MSGMLVAPRAEEKISGWRVAGDGVVAGALRDEVDHQVGLLEEGQRALLTQGFERPLPLLERTPPERQVGQIDLVDRQGLFGLHRGSPPTGAALTTPSAS
jgi:hypothetical protein